VKFLNFIYPEAYSLLYCLTGVKVVELAALSGMKVSQVVE
jgi:hypothetical protein